MSQLKTNPNEPPNDFSSLVSAIESVHKQLQLEAAKSVNMALTVRNWLIGCYIAEYELKGVDRAEYGERLLEHLASKLSKSGVSSCQKRRLYGYLSFFKTYPAIVRSLTAQFTPLLPPNADLAADPKVQPATAQLLDTLSYTHLEQLVALDSDEKRRFYENQCIAGGWSVRELKRQIGSLLFARSQLSTDKQKLNELANADSEKQPSTLTIRDPYIFEFIGLKAAEVMSESHLEDQLLNKLQEFLLELGHGFCFESRQRRILIGDTYNFVDLVFYHRILKCHVLVDLKLADFSHENIGQLNTYVSWYDKNVRTETDNPPIGILLCTGKDSALAEYALAGMNNELFISKYQMELPSKETLQKQIDAERLRLAGESDNETESQ